MDCSMPVCAHGLAVAQGQAGLVFDQALMMSMG